MTNSNVVMRGAAVTELPVPAPAPGIGRHRTDRGSVTVVMLGVIGAVLLLTISGLVLASAVLASHRARAAADLAALAVSGMLMRGEPAGAACAAGAEVASVNHAKLQQCITAATDVRLSVVVNAGIKGVGVATARSRAGPDSSGR
ncbi:MAG: pilus assembly protein TadE [Phycicoccus sp.]|nr:pilus assembly protein TadE [Phycicoccus sp.]NMM34778.1 pilus assembly protein TadE [Phycicoccus sp.]